MNLRQGAPFPSLPLFPLPLIFSSLLLLSDSPISFTLFSHLPLPFLIIMIIIIINANYLPLALEVGPS